MRSPAAPHDERRIESLIRRLPLGFPRGIRWLRRPEARWLRLPAGILLIAGGFLGFLPLLGFWMIPLGLILLAEDIPLLRRTRDWVLNVMERHRPDWFAKP